MNPARRGLFFLHTVYNYVLEYFIIKFWNIHTYYYICEQLNFLSDMNNLPFNGGGPPPQQLTHYKKLANTNYLGSWDMPAGNADLFLTIANVVKENVPNGKGKKDDCVVVHWVQPGWKPMILNATNRKNLHKAIGSPYIEYWRGKTVALYIDHNVRNPDGGGVIDGLRIRNKLPQ